MLFKGLISNKSKLVFTDFSIKISVFSNEEEVKRMTHQLISEKLLVLYKEKVNKKITETSYEKYIELAYKKND